MAIYPGATEVDLVPGFTRPMKPVRANLHTAVSNAGALRPAAGKAWHFYVGPQGHVYQFVDTRFRAAADYEGNADTVSVETWDGYPSGAPGYWEHGSDVPPWTAEQVDALGHLYAWIAAEDDMPLRLATDSRPGPSSHGLSHHRLGINPWRVSGGLIYSTAYAKACPGDRRIAQLAQVLAIATTPAPTPDIEPKEQDDMRIIRNETGGAAFLLAGGVGVKIINGTELKKLQDSGVETSNVGADQFATFAAAYLKG